MESGSFSKIPGYFEDSSAVKINGNSLETVAKLQRTVDFECRFDRTLYSDRLFDWKREHSDSRFGDCDRNRLWEIDAIWANIVRKTGLGVWRHCWFWLESMRGEACCCCIVQAFHDWWLRPLRFLGLRLVLATFRQTCLPLIFWPWCSNLWSLLANTRNSLPMRLITWLYWLAIILFNLI